MIKKLFTFFTALALSIGLWAETQTVSCLYPVYNVPNDVTKGIKEWLTATVNATIVTNADTTVTWGTAGTTTWYVVNGADIKLSKGVVCAGDVRLILADSAKLTAAGIDADAIADCTPSIEVSGDGNSFAIYGQTAQSGQLIINGNDWVAGIGGKRGHDGSNITINGGTITVTAGDFGAALGGGCEGNGFNIIINGGTTRLTGGKQAAAIGGGNERSGHDITINGGTITAFGGISGPAIGGGFENSGHDITINGGTITATGGLRAAGIGGGQGGNGYKITINGGMVTANSGDSDAACIGKGLHNRDEASKIIVAKSLIVKADSINPPTAVITNTGSDLASSLANKQYAIIEHAPAPITTTYIDESGVEHTVDAHVVINTTSPITLGEADTTTWYVVIDADVYLTKGAVCTGDVRLILADDAKLTTTGINNEEQPENSTPGIQVSGDGNSLVIYGQTYQSGQLIAYGGKYAAGIGGIEWYGGSNITINGGTVTTTGGKRAAGIGGGYRSNGSNITINGGMITTNGGYSGAGIGGGEEGKGYDITINGGMVMATGGSSAAGIGGGTSRSGNDITINNGIVMATGGMAAAGIGGGALGGDGFGITINSGIVIVSGGDLAASIGGGEEGKGYKITINGGMVTAFGGADAAGIGNGNNANTPASNIYISDAYILVAGNTISSINVVTHSSDQDMANSLTQQYVKIEEMAAPYRRSVSAGHWATICLPYETTNFSGANFYKVNYYDGANSLYVEEVSYLEAGMPYLFEATADTITVNHNATIPMQYSEVGSEDGLYGSFARKIIVYDTSHSYAVLSGDEVKIIENNQSDTVPACRAYFDMDEMPRTEQPHSKPLRRISIQHHTPTGYLPVEELNHNCGKFLRNNQLVIMKEGKTYNVQGINIQ